MSIGSEELIKKLAKMVIKVSEDKLFSPEHEIDLGGLLSKMKEQQEQMREEYHSCPFCHILMVEGPWSWICNHCNHVEKKLNHPSFGNKFERKTEEKITRKLRLD